MKSKKKEKDLYLCTPCGIKKMKEVKKKVKKNRKSKSKSLGNTEIKDELGFWSGVLCFFIPVVGFAKYANNMPERPKRAKAALLVSSVSLGSFIVGSILSAFSNNNSTQNKEQPKVQEKSLTEILNERIENNTI